MPSFNSKAVKKCLPFTYCAVNAQLFEFLRNVGKYSVGFNKYSTVWILLSPVIENFND